VRVPRDLLEWVTGFDSDIKQLNIMTVEFLTLPDRRLAYQRLLGSPDQPGIVFLGGYASDMTGTKASFLAEKCANARFSFLRFDYRGHGQSSGEFRNGTIGGWFQDVYEAVTRLTHGPQILVGSSMGGWLGLMLAARMPGRVKAFIGIAAAPDFTEELMWKQFTPEQRVKLERDGEIYDETAPPGERAPVTLNLIKEARQHLLLGGPISISCPVYLLQGTQDKEVPAEYAARIKDKITSGNVKVTLVKDGDHRLSRPQDLDLLWKTVTVAAEA
jgi:pimeloyl-ACP methyl ester carboxylesterase